MITQAELQNEEKILKECTFTPKINSSYSQKSMTSQNSSLSYAPKGYELAVERMRYANQSYLEKKEKLEK
jgi:hypothetical protein